ncbi:MAG: hypothetical protein A2Y71_06410 [Bacteroidetes bacterium RBG_13_42_15]|nr:MAG: hypothetical protein A2Y71_06410 [Bacteroidetes bacterium RBG_13_42_15]
MTSCEKTANETDPVKIIIGKWETIEMGNWPNMEPVEPIGYREFLSDSVLIEYSYQTQEFKYKKYWIDSLLYECFLLENLSTCTLVRRYSFEFFDNNKKLRLDYVDIAALFNTFILKRKD